MVDALSSLLNINQNNKIYHRDNSFYPNHKGISGQPSSAIQSSQFIEISISVNIHHSNIGGHMGRHVPQDIENRITDLHQQIHDIFDSIINKLSQEELKEFEQLPFDEQNEFLAERLSAEQEKLLESLEDEIEILRVQADFGLSKTDAENLIKTEQEIDNIIDNFLTESQKQQIQKLDDMIAQLYQEDSPIARREISKLESQIDQIFTSAFEQITDKDAEKLSFLEQQLTAIIDKGQADNSSDPFATIFETFENLLNQILSPHQQQQKQDYEAAIMHQEFSLSYNVLQTSALNNQAIQHSNDQQIVDILFLEESAII